MAGPNGVVISYNGEIYNYKEIREELGSSLFKTASDTEVILHAYNKWGTDCVSHLRGMFAFAIWDEKEQSAFIARDRFGVKPLYYAIENGVLYAASEAKALLPFLPRIETDQDGFLDYLTFQFCLDGKTLFKGIKELIPGHMMTVRHGTAEIRRYWEIYYKIDRKHNENYFAERLCALLEDAVSLHLRSDVPVGSYVSGGLDSSLVASMAAPRVGNEFKGFIGRFDEGPEYDEYQYAAELSKVLGFPLYDVVITHDDFSREMENVIYHMDYPAAGPGSFPQYMVSKLAASHMKVVLGGQGGDEILGGYTRYLVAYFEQCIKAAIDGTMDNGNFIVTYKSIIPNLATLRSYKPMLQEFWRDGLFDDMDKRYFRLINRAPSLGGEIRWEALGKGYDPYETFRKIYQSDNVRKESYFDGMTHFDCKTLLPALLHVEDRMSMASGLESRVPLLDHPLVEFAATLPANVKFKNGELKHILRIVSASRLPKAILERKDKMGFPVPLVKWLKGPLAQYINDIFTSSQAVGRDLIDNAALVRQIEKEPQFGRKIWGLLCIELWQRRFHDRAHEFSKMREEAHAADQGSAGCEKTPK
jgi:asparagine synthase (glutamine-hydrolysing)